MQDPMAQDYLLNSAGVSENRAIWAPWSLVAKELKHALWGIGQDKASTYEI
jgi:hypothetical protein